jgi:hypothetical protein
VRPALVLKKEQSIHNFHHTRTPTHIKIMMMYSYRSADENQTLPDSITSDNGETVIVDCPIKHRTDDLLGGIKIQIYGLDSYGYRQYKTMVRQGLAASVPQELEESLASQEWIDFWSVRVSSILKKHKRYEWLVHSWIVVGIFVCTALMADFWIGFAMAVIVVVLIWRVSSYPKSCKRELAEMCIDWSEEQRRTNRSSVEARFFQEHGPPTKHGRNALGVIQFLNTSVSRYELEQQQDRERMVPAVTV